MPFYKADDVVEILKDAMSKLDSTISELEYPLNLMEESEDISRCLVFINRNSARHGVVHSEYIKNFTLPYYICQKINNLKVIENTGKTVIFEDVTPTFGLRELDKIRDDYNVIKAHGFLGKEVHVITITERYNEDVCVFGIGGDTTVDNIMSSLHKRVEMDIHHNEMGNDFQKYIKILKSYYVGDLFNEYMITINHAFNTSKQGGDIIAKCIEELLTNSQ